MATIADQFKASGLIAWWQAPITQGFNGGTEKGTDYGLGGFNKPVGSLTGGKVVYVGDGGYAGSSIGKIVQVLTPDGNVVHYQHLYSSNVLLGQNISPGTVIGHGGGCPVGGYPANFSGNACTFTDQYSTGQHIEVRYAQGYNAAQGVWSQNWVAPQGIFSQLGNAFSGGVPPVSTTGGGQVASSPFLGGLPAPVAGTTFFGELGQKIGLFLLAFTLIGMGFYTVFSKEINASVGKAKDIAVKAAEASV